MYRLLRSKRTASSEKYQEPFSKKDNIYYAKDLITLHTEPSTAEWEIYINGDITTGKGFPELHTFLMELSDESRKRKRGKAAENTRLIIFADRLTIIRNWISHTMKVEFASEFDADIITDICFEITTDCIQFRNWESIANDRLKNLYSLYPGLRDTEVMAEVVKGFDAPTWKVRYSLAHMTQKEFFKPILDKVRSERGNTNWESLDCYENSGRGSRAGLYAQFYEDSNICWKVHENVKSFDKKSAYPSIFVNDDKFPLGRCTQHRMDKMKWLSKCLKEDTWFKIVVRTTYDFGKEMKAWKSSKESGTYGIEYYDYKAIAYIGWEDNLLNWLEEHYDDWVILTSESTGYLSTSFRERIIELYNLKNSIADKNDPMRRKYKTMLDMLFGKGIQRRKYTYLRDINDFYFSHSDCVLMPHQSMHAIAAVKYELIFINSWLEDGEVPDVIAFDTDGIKLSANATDAPIKHLNAKVKWKNKKAGFEGSDIGLWEHEYTAKRFVQFKTKCYAYEDDNGIHWKLAGVHKDVLDDFLKGIKGDPIDYILQNGASFRVPSNYIYNVKAQTFTPTSNEYLLKHI